MTSSSFKSSPRSEGGCYSQKSCSYQPPGLVFTMCMSVAKNFTPRLPCRFRPADSGECILSFFFVHFSIFFLFLSFLSVYTLALFANCGTTYAQKVKEEREQLRVITRICKAKWAEPFNPPPPLSLSLSVHKLEFLNWLGLDLLQRAVRFLKRCTSGSACC